MLKQIADAILAKFKATRENLMTTLNDKAEAAKYKTEAELLTMGAKVAEEKARLRWHSKSK